MFLALANGFCDRDGGCAAAPKPWVVALLFVFCGLLCWTILSAASRCSMAAISREFLAGLFMSPMLVARFSGEFTCW